jgi:pyochelin biosynthesis protein PchC
VSRDSAPTWLRRYRPRPAARLRLVCFPHGSGNATFYRPWAALLPDDVELVAVQYPGRLDRIAEPCVVDMATMVARASEALADVLPHPTILFGHSMGASIAYEVARAAERRYGGPLAGLVVSGRPSPRRQRRDDLYLAGDDALWDELRRLDGTSADVLEHPELRAALMPSLRGDYQLIGTYTPVPGPPLATPILALTGDEDPEAAVPEVADWERYTTAGFALRVFPGNHFYLVPRRDAVLAAITDALVRPPARADR